MIEIINFIDLPDEYRSPKHANDSVEIHNQEIITQNARFIASNDLAIPDIKALVRSDISDEQIDSVQHLFDAAMGTDYSDIGNRVIEAYAILEDAQVEAHEASASLERRRGEVEKEVERAIELSPSKAERIRQLGELSLQRAKDTMLSASGKRVEALKVAAEQADNAYMQSAHVWEIPQSLSQSDVSSIYEMTQSDQNEPVVIVEDILPINPVERQKQADIVDRARHEVENKEASEFITYYLAERVDEVVTVEDLIRFLYSIDERVLENRQYRTRITSLLGPAVQGHRIRGYLNDRYGMELQYGWRFLKEKDGDSDRWMIRRKTRIYRAVFDGADPLSASSVLKQNGLKVSDEWENTPTTVSDPEPQLPPEAKGEDLLGSDSDTARQPNAEEDRDDLEKLRDDVAASLDLLEKSNLLIDDVMRASYIRLVAGSNVLGTKTSRERLQAAGIMKVSEVKREEMTRRQLVISSVFNRNRILWQRGKKQREALNSIDEMIAEKLKTIEDDRNHDEE